MRCGLLLRVGLGHELAMRHLAGHELPILDKEFAGFHAVARGLRPVRFLKQRPAWSTLRSSPPELLSCPAPGCAPGGVASQHKLKPPGLRCGPGTSSCFRSARARRPQAQGCGVGVTPTNHTFGFVDLALFVLSNASWLITCAVPVLPPKSMPSRCSPPAVWYRPGCVT